MNDRIYTVGHSNHSIETFISLLQKQGITALADVRSHPYSRHQPQFNRETLQRALRKADINYVFLGKELGARSENPKCYRNGKVQYGLLAREPSFQEGLARLRKGMESHRIAMMCAEKEPLDCHRTILVGYRLREQGIDVAHILSNGEMETREETEKRLLALLKLPEFDMFRSREEILAEAYALQSQRIAYEDKRIALQEREAHA